MRLRHQFRPGSCWKLDVKWSRLGGSKLSLGWTTAPWHHGLHRTGTPPCKPTQPCSKTFSQHLTEAFHDLFISSLVPDIMSATAMLSNHSTALLQGRTTTPRASFRARIAPALSRRGRMQIIKAGEPFYSVSHPFCACVPICPLWTYRNPIRGCI